MECCKYKIYLHAFNLAIIIILFKLHEKSTYETAQHNTTKTKQMQQNCAEVI